MNREQWLMELSKAVKPFYKAFKLAEFRVSCGWPCKNGLGKQRRVVGECHAIESSKGNLHEIFISPTLDQPLIVAGTLCHEIAHVAAGVGAGHGGVFVKVCKYVGLTKGKPTTAMPGEALEAKISRVIEKLGKYPHSALEPKLRTIERPLTIVRVICQQCGCPATMSVKWLEEAGLPTCGCGGQMVIPEG